MLLMDIEKKKLAFIYMEASVRWDASNRINMVYVLYFCFQNASEFSDSTNWPSLSEVQEVSLSLSSSQDERDI